MENIGDAFDHTPKKTELYFWGEWEPQSRFELTGNPFSIKTQPHAIHYPFFSTTGIGRHNTDPFVFGDHFYYTNCKQKLKGLGRKMLTLTNHSIILFGSEIDRKYFVMDTLFVVDTSETIKDYHIHNQGFSLGIKLEMPEIKDDVDVPQSKNIVSGCGGEYVECN